jgi:hypothetical protein
MDKIKNQLRVSVSNSFVDKGDGLVEFPNGLTITDGSIMRSGTRYDIGSLNVQDYPGQLTADHFDSLGTLIGKVNGVRKEGDRVVVNSIDYAVKQNPYARLAYDLLVGGYSNSFSIETMGPYPDEGDRTYRNHELVGLSQVVVPNNYNAKTNQFNEIVHNSLERSQQDGLDITGVEEKIFSSIELKSSETVKEESMTKTETNTSEVEKPAEAEVVTPTQVEEAAKEETKVDTVVKPEAPEAPAPAETTEKTEEKTEVKTTEVKSEAPKEEVKTEEVKTEEVKTETEVEKTETKPAEKVEEEKVENKTNKTEEKLEMTAEQIAEIVANAIKPLADELKTTKELAQNALDTQAKEPEFKEEVVVTNSYADMSEEELFAKQLNAAVAVERMNSVEGAKVLHDINERNLQALKDAKIVNAAMTLVDLGNFVIGPELYNQVTTARTDYTAILNATTWKETQSIEFGWLTRGSDIDMTNVAIGITGDNGSRLKPVSSPTYGANSEKLEELAAVTPISINVIKFAAADILADVAEGYRNDYDRKRAQLVVIRLQQAVNATGNKWTFDISDGLLGWAQVVALISDVTTVGTLVFNSKTLAALKGQAIASNNAAVLTELGAGSILGTPFVLVPNDLLPTINTAETRTFKVNGVNVTIDQSVFYGNLSTFTGRSSGGLKYDVDGSASYEISGTVFSAYQRNEVVLRGSFFRGGVVKDTSQIASIRAVAVS